MRDAINLLEQLATYYDSEIGLSQVQAVLGITGDWRAKELVKHIVNNDISAGVATINSVNSDGLDLRQFNRELVEYLRGLLLIKTGSDEAVDLTAEDIVELKALAVRAPLEQILRAVRLFGQLELGFDNYPTLPLELALVDCALTSEGRKETQAKPAEYELPQPKKVVVPPPAPSHREQPAAEPRRAGVPTPEPVVAAAATSPLQAGSEVERLRLNWKQVIEQAPPDTKRTPALAILRSAGVKPISFENDTLVLAFRYQNHKELIEKVENQQVAEKIISNFLGRPCHVNCVLEDNNHLIKAALKMGAQIIDTEGK
jgi:DNA polymerase-3 subunit gamma/tau